MRILIGIAIEKLDDNSVFFQIDSELEVEEEIT